MKIRMGSSVIPPEVWDHLFALHPGATFESYYRAVTDSRTHLTHYRGLIERNQAFHHLTQSLDVFQARLKKWNEEQSKEKVEGTPPKPDAVSGTQMFSALGKFQTRDVLATLRMYRNGKPSPLPRLKKDSFAFNLKQSVLFASKVESFCEERRWASPEVAYFAGLVYDWTAYRMSLDKGASAKEGRTALDDAFKEGMRMAQVAYGITTHYKNLKHANLVFGAALLAPIGKAWLTWLFPKAEGAKGSYKELSDQWNTGSFRRERWLLQEKKKFPLGHSEVSALVVGFSRFFHPVEKAISVYMDPALIKRVAPDQYEIAHILQVAAIVGTPDLLARFDINSTKLTERDRQAIRSITAMKTEHWGQIASSVREAR